MEVLNVRCMCRYPSLIELGVRIYRALAVVVSRTQETQKPLERSFGSPQRCVTVK